MDKTTVVEALIVVESILVTLLLRFDGSVPGMYWGSLILAAISLVLFLVGLNYLGGTVSAAVALILLNLATGLVPNSVILMRAVLTFVLLVVVRLYRTHAADDVQLGFYV